MKNGFLKKLTSRKFLMAAITALAGLVTMIVGDSATVRTLAGAAMTVIPTVVYCVMEGVIDAESVRTVTDASLEAAAELGAERETLAALESLGDAAEAFVGESEAE